MDHGDLSLSFCWFIPCFHPHRNHRPLGMNPAKRPPPAALQKAPPRSGIVWQVGMEKICGKWLEMIGNDGKWWEMGSIWCDIYIYMCIYIYVCIEKKKKEVFTGNTTVQFCSCLKNNKPKKRNLWEMSKIHGEICLRSRPDVQPILLGVNPNINHP